MTDRPSDRAIAQQPAEAGKVAEGWKLVPRVPTEAMIEAGFRWHGRAAYDAMLAAAPTNYAEISSKSVVEPTAEHWRRATALARKDAEIAELRARIADAPTVCADTDNIVEIAHSLGYYHGTRVALVVVND